MKTIGFFGGTFDPLHVGHLHLAIQLLERCDLDEVLFCPAFCSPFKTAQPPLASPQHRLAMLQSVIAEIPQFRVTAMEIERGGPSYTVETLRLLAAQKEVQYHLLIADDAASYLHSWKESEEVVRLAPPLVGTRGSLRPFPPSPIAQILECGRVTIPKFDISSTEVRERLKNKLYCGHLIPRKALDYIQRHGLY